jgi:hypothetical protein
LFDRGVDGERVDVEAAAAEQAHDARQLTGAVVDQDAQQVTVFAHESPRR